MYEIVNTVMQHSLCLPICRSNNESRAFSNHSSWVFMDATNMLFVVGSNGSMMYHSFLHFITTEIFAG